MVLDAAKVKGESGAGGEAEYCGLGGPRSGIRRGNARPIRLKPRHESDPPSPWPARPPFTHLAHRRCQGGTRCRERSLCRGRLDRSHACVFLQIALLAHGAALRARGGITRVHGPWLFLCGEPLPRLGARRHAHRRADPFRGERKDGGRTARRATHRCRRRCRCLGKGGGKRRLPRDWIGEEVSHDPRYTNSRLSEQPFQSWG